MFEYRAVVLFVIDGDTVKFDVDLGFHVHTEANLRIEGINAPELHVADPHPGAASRRHLQGLLPVGAGIVIVTRKSREFDKYGRLLAKITLANGQDVGALMIESGHAVAYDGGRRGT